MSRTRGAAPILPIAVVIAGFTALSAISAAPIAHADTIDNIIGTVVKDRAKTHCPPLHYDLILEAAARQETLQNVVDPDDLFRNYKGKAHDFRGLGDPVAQALTNAYVEGAGTAINDCKYVDFGVAFFRDVKAEKDTVTLVFGVPTASPPPVVAPPVLKPIPAQGPSPFGSSSPPAPAPAPPAPVPPAVVAAPTATVTADVDVFDNPNGDGQALPNFLKKGTKVAVKKPCTPNAFCALADGTFAWGEFLKNN
jgi:hypothetical protein